MNLERLKSIDHFLAETYVNSGKFPGVSLVVNHKGRPVHRVDLGNADIERGKPMADDTIVRIYSMTKPVTSIALMMLVEDGLLQLDDPVSRYIPQWHDLQVYVSGTLESGFVTRPPSRPMQVIDLLRHTSGLTYAFQNISNVDAAYRMMKVGEIEKSGTLQGMIDSLAVLPLEFSPGEGWTYSVASDVLGWIIQKVSGQKLEDFFAERIFAPLAMEDTGFHVAEGQGHRFASCYERAPDGRLMLQDDAQTSTFLKPPSFISGGGGLVSTANDYMKFCEALRTGSPRLVGRKTWDLMRANHLPGGKYLPQMSRAAFSEAFYDGVGFGLGCATTCAVERTMVAGSNGDCFWGGVASTFFLIDPAEELSLVFLTQFMPSSFYPVRRQLRSMVYAAL